MELYQMWRSYKQVGQYHIICLLSAVQQHAYYTTTKENQSPSESGQTKQTSCCSDCCSLVSDQKGEWPYLVSEQKQLKNPSNYKDHWTMVQT